MKNSDPVKLGIIGMGNMGAAHAKTVAEGAVLGLSLAAVADANPTRLEKWTEQEQFSDGSALIQSGSVDAVLIATPHYSHTPLGIEVLEKGLHLLVEKPNFRAQGRLPATDRSMEKSQADFRSDV